MQKKNIKSPQLPDDLYHQTIERVYFSTKHHRLTNELIDKAIIALQSNRYFPKAIQPLVGEIKNSPFHGFNVGMHVGDIAESVEINRRYLQEKLPKDTKIQWLEQVHGAEVVTVSTFSQQPLIADAAITREKNIALAVMTADCLPILLTSKKGDEIAVIHGGWRPLANGIISNTVNQMHTCNTDILAWLGPCIGQKAFEVGHEVRDVFTAADPAFSIAFKENEKGKFLADLQGIATLQFTALGITNIARCEQCTFSNPQKYYSYRFNAVTGRMASVICMDISQ